MLAWPLLAALLIVLPAAASADDLPFRVVGPQIARDEPVAGPPPAQKEVIIRGLPATTWDPHVTDFGSDIAHFPHLWRGLYHPDEQGRPVPSMAQSDPTISADGQTYTITLRAGLKWSDGAPLTAADFVAGLLRTCSPAQASHYQYVLSAVVGCSDYYGSGTQSASQQAALRAAVGVKALNDRTVEIRLTSPMPSFTSILTLWPTYPVPRHKVPFDSSAWPEPLQNAYNGPFLPESLDATRMKLVRNPYWSGTAAKVDRLTIIYIDDPTVGVAAYGAGEVDATLAPAPALAVLRQQFGSQLVEFPGPRTIGIQFNLQNAVLAKPGVRLALSQAVDREAFVSVVFGGAHFPTTNWVPPLRSGLAGGEYDDLIGYNVEKARASLASAGYPNGDGLPVLQLIQTDSATNRLASEYLKAAWGNIGVEVELLYFTSQARNTAYNNKQFHLMLGGWQEDYPDPENWFSGLFETGGSINKTSTSIPALDALLAAAKSETDDTSRRAAYREAEHLLLKEASGIAPLYHTRSAFLVKSYLAGLKQGSSPGDTFAPGEWHSELWSTSKP